MKNETARPPTLTQSIMGIRHGGVGERDRNNKVQYADSLENLFKPIVTPMQWHRLPERHRKARFEGSNVDRRWYLHTTLGKCPFLSSLSVVSACLSMYIHMLVLWCAVRMILRCMYVLVLCGVSVKVDAIYVVTFFSCLSK